MAINHFYKDIEKLVKNKVPDGRGGTKLSYSVENTFKGLINQVTSNEVEMAGKLGIDASHKLYCDVSENLDNDDLLLFEGEYFRVVSKPKNTVDRNHHFKILLKQISLDKEHF